MDKTICKSQRHTWIFFYPPNGNDEKVGAWATKSLPSLSQTTESDGSRTYKLISVTGNHLHGILHEAGPHRPIGPNKNKLMSQNQNFLEI